MSEASVEDRRPAGKKSERNPPLEVKGNTLRVYLFLLRHGPCELREVQRGLDLSTPSLASYHLDKLLAVGYASRKENGQYVASKDVPSDIIDGFTRIGVLLVPQLFFVATLFTTLVGYFAFMSLHSTAYVHHGDRLRRVRSLDLVLNHDPRTIGVPFASHVSSVYARTTPLSPASS